MESKMRSYCAIGRLLKADTAVGGEAVAGC